jgi:hypothetical protein
VLTAELVVVVYKIKIIIVVMAIIMATMGRWAAQLPGEATQF